MKTHPHSQPLFSAQNFKKKFPDFNLSLRCHGYNDGKFQRYYTGLGTSDTPKYFREKEALKELYIRNYQKNTSTSNQVKIPRIIHQIWMGNPMPDQFKPWTKTWQNIPGWEYRLWTEKEVSSLSLHNKDLYEAAQNYGERPDILRYEILHQMGGLYVDTDVECFDPFFFEYAHQAWSFYAGLQPLEWDLPLCVGTAVLASSPGHLMLKKLVYSLKEHTKKLQQMNEPSLDIDGEEYPPIVPEMELSKTGPLYLTEIILKNKNLLLEDGIILPPSFFYPIVTRGLPEKDIYRFDETCAIHYWATHWQKEEGAFKS